MSSITDSKRTMASAAPELEDLQNQPDGRGIAIDRVGIRELAMPIRVHDRDQYIQETVGKLGMFVNLSPDLRGTHMSRFIEVLNDHNRLFGPERMEGILKTMRNRLRSTRAFLEVDFPFFRLKSSPVTELYGPMNYQVSIQADQTEDHTTTTLTVRIPVNTLCPCSKSISEYGAHNQRGQVSVRVRFHRTIWIQCLIDIVEDSASSELYSLLKRPDEKLVTELAYDHPVFVEDLARNVVERLRRDQRIVWYRVEAENQESIHNHNAYAMIQSAPIDLSNGR